MEQKNTNPDDTVAAETFPEELKWEIAESVFLTLWCYHATVWEGKEIVVMVKIPAFLIDLPHRFLDLCEFYLL